MSQEAERVYTINLGKVWLSPNNQRAKRAINMIREFTEHHMKTGQIKIDQDLSHAIWERGIRSPPRKIRVRMAKTDDGYVMVSPYEEEEKPKAKKEEPKVEAKEEKTEEKPTKEEKKAVEKPAKKEEKKAEKKAEEKPKEKKAEPKKPSKKKAKKSAKKSK
ncbi:50S ribosomal protein L31e [Candidatus Nitrosotenuis aquarius]|uniref:50S ribosomal protein L31e n=1 Tax=Candidatus Nitrosotenuis aquarius TaxID=1846278 RepID=UPI000C1EBA7E|nr:50S ribosomal protein L31e [Candidatus Nitrosotenuis aquarius]